MWWGFRLTESCQIDGKKLEPFNKASIQMINRTLDCQGTKHITGVNTNCPLETDQHQLTPAWKDMKFRERKQQLSELVVAWWFCRRCSTSVGFSTLSPPTLQWSGSCAKVPGFFQNHGNNSLRRFFMEAIIHGFEKLVVIKVDSWSMSSS